MQKLPYLNNVNYKSNNQINYLAGGISNIYPPENIQDDEVQAAKWMTIEEFEKIIDSGNASDTSFDVFKKYYEKFYNRYLVFEDGKPVFKKIEKKN